MMLLRKRKHKLQLDRKYLQTVHLTKDLELSTEPLQLNNKTTKLK